MKVASLTKPVGEVKLDVHAYRVEVDDNCTLCGVCAWKCLTLALSTPFPEKTVKLAVDPGKCAGCNYWVNVCKEYAIGVVKEGYYVYLREDYSYTPADDGNSLLQELREADRQQEGVNQGSEVTVEISRRADVL